MRTFYEVERMNEAQLAEAAQALLSARASNTPFDETSHPAKLTSLDDVYAIQARVAAASGAVGGWKIGALSPIKTKPAQ